MTFHAPAWLVASLFFAALAGGAPRTPDEMPVSEDYVLRVWDLAEGFSDNHIGSIERDPDGYLWITNFDGLLRFDGDRVVNAHDGMVAGMPTEHPSPVIVARNGSLWFGIERGGVGRIRNGVADTVVPSASSPGPTWWPSDLEEGPDGSVWAGMNDEGRVIRIQGETTSAFGLAEGVPSGRETRVCADADGVVWVATTGGCATFDGRRFNEVDPGAGGSRRPVLAPARAGGMWTSRSGRLLRYDGRGNRLETLNSPWFRTISQINTLLEDASGALWIGTLDSGLFRYKDGRFERVTTSFNDIFTMTEDDEGNIWCGTWGGGLNRLSPRRFFLRQIQHDDAPGEVVRSVFEDGEKRLWVIGRYGRILLAEGSGPRAFPHVELPAVECRAATLDPASGAGVWLGTTQGLMRWEHGRVSLIFSSKPIVSLLAEENGVVWAGTEFGPLLRYEDGRVESFDPVRAARAMALDQQGRLWVGTEHGEIFAKKGAGFEALTMPGLQPNQTVRFIQPDGRDTLWIGILQGGLYRCQNGEIRKVPEAPKGALREPRCLLIESRPPRWPERPEPPSADDVFWIGTATGLLRTTRGAIDDALESDQGSVEFMTIGPNEGVPNTEFAMGFQNGALQTGDGRLLFGTRLGLLEVPANHARRPTKGRVVIEEAVSPDLALYSPAPQPWVFPPNPDVIRIRYTLPELGAPEQVRFRYRLHGDGQDGPWVDVGRQREITLAQPAPGTYLVEVSAAVADGPWTDSPAAAKLVVRATWWETALFRWAVVLLAIGLIAAIARGVEMQRIRRRIRRLEQEGAIERERARIARDMHDEVGASLTHIATTSRLAAMDSPEAVGEHLRDIESAAKHTVESLDEIVWAVNPRNDTVARTVEYICKFAAVFLTKTGVRPEVTAPEIIPHLHISAEARHHLFLATKEAIHNIAKHSGARVACIRVDVGPTRLQIVVQDDGQGFAADDADGFSNGLINMRERMSAIGGRCVIESRPAIQGCRITFELSLASP